MDLQEISGPPALLKAFVVVLRSQGTSGPNLCVFQSTSQLKENLPRLLFLGDSQSRCPQVHFGGIGFHHFAHRGVSFW